MAPYCHSYSLKILCSVPISINKSVNCSRPWFVWSINLGILTLHSSKLIPITICILLETITVHVFCLLYYDYLSLIYTESSTTRPYYHRRVYYVTIIVKSNSDSPHYSDGLHCYTFRFGFINSSIIIIIHYYTFIYRRVYHRGLSDGTMVDCRWIIYVI